MAVTGGFRSDLSITRKTDGNLETFPRVFCFPKSRIKENGGNHKNYNFHNCKNLLFFTTVIFQVVVNLNQLMATLSDVKQLTPPFSVF